MLPEGDGNTGRAQGVKEVEQHDDRIDERAAGRKGQARQIPAETIATGRAMLRMNLSGPHRVDASLTRTRSDGGHGRWGSLRPLPVESVDAQKSPWYPKSSRSRRRERCVTVAVTRTVIVSSCAFALPTE